MGKTSDEFDYLRLKSFSENPTFALLLYWLHYMGCIYTVNNCPDWLRHIENARNIRPVGTRGAHPQILTDQSTLSRQGGQIMPTTLLLHLPDFQTLLRPWISWQERNQSVLELESPLIWSDDIFPGSLCNCTFVKTDR